MAKIAIAQMNPELLNVPSNVDKTISMMSDSNKKHAKLVVFPELSLTGCALTREEAKLVAEPLSGNPIKKIIEGRLVVRDSMPRSEIN